MGKTEKIIYILDRLKENLVDESIEKDATFMVYFCEEMMEVINRSPACYLATSSREPFLLF